jgi:hypothetical protein
MHRSNTTSIEELCTKPIDAMNVISIIAHISTKVLAFDCKSTFLDFVHKTNNNLFVVIKFQMKLSSKYINMYTSRHDNALKYRSHELMCR